MRARVAAPSSTRRPDLDHAPRLLLSLLTRYLFFLTRRPISRSNAHYLQQRLDGLRSLAELLDGADLPASREIVQTLRRINPANFSRLAERLQYALLPLTAATSEIPWDVVVSDQPPRADFLAGTRRILLLLGPAIGVGDEIMTFPLPTWLKAAQPAAEVTVLSAYQGLWDRVNGVERVIHYTDYASLAPALRGEPPVGHSDLVILIDFERPDLHQAICYEPAIERFVELSLGAQSLVAVDNRHRWLHRAPRPVPYCANYYLGLDYLLRWLGLTPRLADRFATIMRRAAAPPAEPLSIYVNPFTSKFDPSLVYWSRLLSALVPPSPPRPVRFSVDPGPNPATAQFAAALVRSAAARLPGGVEALVARPTGGALPSLQQVFAQIEQAQVVICSDSFTAHAAPLFGATVLVLADAGLQDWRVPSAASYYFDAEAPIEQVVAAMRQVLWLGQPAPLAGTPPLSAAEHDLIGATTALRRVAHECAAADLASVQTAYRHFVTAYQQVVTRLDDWPAEFRGLLDDVAYARRLHPPVDHAAVPPELASASLRHLRDRLQQWENTNLCKYLDRIVNNATA